MPVPESQQAGDPARAAPLTAPDALRNQKKKKNAVGGARRTKFNDVFSQRTATGSPAETIEPYPSLQQLLGVRGRSGCYVPRLWLSEVTRRGRGAPADRRDPREHAMLVSVSLGVF